MSVPKVCVCKDVTYKVYAFDTISQGYPNILSCNLSKDFSYLSDHVIRESYGIHYNPLVRMKSLDHLIYKQCIEYSSAH